MAGRWGSWIEGEGGDGVGVDDVSASASETSRVNPRVLTSMNCEQASQYRVSDLANTYATLNLPLILSFR